MKDIYIQGSRDVYIVPTVKFLAKQGSCEISGESFLEETIKFYQPLFEWLREFTAEIRKPITFNVKLTYFNTSTSKCILTLLGILKKFEDDGGEVTVNWFYDEDDEDMKDDIEDYVVDSGMKINLIPLD